MPDMTNGERLRLLGWALLRLVARFVVFTGLVWAGLWLFDVRAPNLWSDTPAELVVWFMLATLAHIVAGGPVLRFLTTAARGAGLLRS